MAIRRLFMGFVLTALLSLAAVPAFTQDTQELEVWIAFTDHRLTWAEKVAEDFEALNPGLDIVIQSYADYEPLIDAYTLAQENGTPPDVIQLFEVGTQFALDSGWFKPVAEIIDGRDEVLGQPVNFDDIVAPVSQYYTIDGQWASVGWNSSTPITYANKTLMDAVGLEEVPETWSELEAACAMFSDMVAAGDLSGCVTWPNHGWFFEQWLAQQNTDMVNNGNGREGRATEVMLTTEAAQNIVEWHQEMYNNGMFVYSGVQRDWEGTVQAFNTQSVPFIMTSSASARGIVQNAMDNNFEVVTSMMMYDDEVGYTGNAIGGATMWVTDGLAPEAEELAVAFLLYFSNTENSASWHMTSGYIPLRQSSIELLENVPADNNLDWDFEANDRTAAPEGNWFELNPNFRTASEQLNNSAITTATQGAIFGTFIETRNIVTQAIEDAMLLGGDVAEILATAEAEANTLLEEYNLLYVVD